MKIHPGSNYFNVVTVICNFAIVKQQLERVTDLLVQLLQGANLNSNGAQPVDAAPPGNNQHIIILGDLYDTGDGPVLDTAEKYNRLEKRST